MQLAVKAALARTPVPGDPAMRALGGAVIGTPALARSPEGAPAFWLVPLEIRARTCGFARVELSGVVAQVGSFGAGTEDTSSWPEADFFRRPPARVLDEVRAKHAGAPLAEPMLSFDASPAKWAWRVAVGEPVSSVVYITPGGWYERPSPRAMRPGREG